MRQASLVIAPALMLALLGILSYGCAGRGGRNLERGIVLDSGLDKKPGAGYAGAPAADIAASAEYDSQYRGSVAGESYEEAAAASPSKEMDDGVPTRPAADTLARIGNWFSPAAYAQDTKIDEKYLIRAGDISIDVDDFDASVEKVYDLADSLGGFVTDSDIRGESDNVRSGWITVRVPNTRFFSAFTELSKLGEVTAQTISSEDVSRQYVAAVSRLRNLTLEQETLRKMLDEALVVQRARGLGEGYKILLDTQQRLSEVTGQIESTEDQISAFADRITNSTIRVNLRQRPKYESAAFSWGMGATFDAAKKELLAVVRAIGQALVRFVVVGWIYLLPWLLIGWVLFKVYRRYLAPRIMASKPAAAGSE